MRTWQQCILSGSFHRELSDSDWHFTMSIRYVNTDLDLVAPFDTTALTDSLESRGLRPLNPPSQPSDGQWYCHLEITADADPDEPETTIGIMLDAIEALDAEAAELWSHCTTREFNIGYDCGDEPWAFNQGLSNRTLTRIAALGATVRITIYPERAE